MEGKKDLRFRVWAKRGQKWIEFEPQELEKIEEMREGFVNWATLSQFTKLKDVDGKDIWEGDTVSFSSAESGPANTIEWSEGKWAVLCAGEHVMDLTEEVISRENIRVISNK